MHPKNKNIPTGNMSLKNCFLLLLTWSNFFFSINKKKGKTAKKPTKNLTELKENLGKDFAYKLAV